MTQNKIDAIQKQIDAIGEALAWIKKHKPEQYDQRFQQLVQERLKLRKIKEALRENPAIAAYGESQKGKTHVMNSLLLKDRDPFKVETPEGLVDFIDEINPHTEDTEATGVVTRFSSFENPDGTTSNRYQSKHPVLIKVLSVTEMATIFCDSYFNDIDNPHLPSTAQVEEFAYSLEAKYADFVENVNSPVTEDDIFELRNYMIRNLDDSKQKIYTESIFFVILSHIIRRIPFNDLPMVFSVLWNNNSYLTEQYARLIHTIQSLGFAREVYADIETIRNNQNTIIGVDCLAGLMPEGWDKLASIYKSNVEQARYTHVFLINTEDSNGTERRVDNIAKCELSAICSEIVLHIDAKNLATDVSYDLSKMPAESQLHISKSGFRKDIFHSNDLLDFPGARTRDHKPIEEVSKNIDQMVKRGKVAYLFHKYSEGHLFNILLFCQDHKQASVKEMYKLLAQWVRTFVGRTPEERARMIQRTQVPPFFIVGTKFNCDMVYDSQKPSSNTEEELSKKWVARFDKVLWAESLERGAAASGTNDQWFINWLAADGSRPFDNCYVLRDFKYSSGTIYKGYNAQIVNSCEVELEIPQTHYDNLRRTFIESPDVKRFFSNPSLAWDVAATINNDGSQYIIERVSIVAKHISLARQEQLAEKQAEITRRVTDILKDYFVDEDADKLLKMNVKKAKKVMRELDFCIQNDNYFFGHMIERLQVTERDTYTVLHKLVQGTELNQKTTDFGNVSLILKRYGKQLEACHNDNERWAVLQEELVMDSREEVEEYLSRKGIDPTTIFAPSKKKHLNSVIIADKTFDAWEGKLRSPSMIDELSNGEEFDSVVMSHLIDNIIETAKQMQLADHIASTIAEFVNVLVTTTINESLVADLLATEINNFVNNLGYNFREEQEIMKLKELCEELGLNCFDHIDKPRQESFSDEELTKMFDDFNENENTLTPSFALNYEQWVEYMIISFIGKTAVGDYDREANHRMGEIIRMIG